MEKQISKITLILFFITALIFGCAKQEVMNDEYVIQIKDVGLRKGVFIRRYEMTKDYGKHKEFTPEILKNFINDILLPRYLFIQDAYTLGKDEDTNLRQKVHDFKVNTIASNHPITCAELIIQKEELYDFYLKQSVTYDVDLVLASSSVMADDIYDFMLKGGRLKPPTENQQLSFPKLIQYKNISYGQKMIHPDVYEKMETMRQGEISKPIYNMGMWTIILLNKKNKNSEQQAFDLKNEELIANAQAILKYKQQKQFIEELKNNYQITVHTEYYQSLISAYTSKNNDSWIDKTKFDKADLEQPIIQINNENITLSDFITNFNLATQHVTSPRIVENDLTHFVDDYIAKYLLYLDVLEKGIELDTLTKDKLENKEHRLLYNKYLKEEIAQRTIFCDKDVKKHYENNRNKWRGEYTTVISSVKNDLRMKLQKERYEDVLKNLRKKYKVRYNEVLLQELAKQLTDEKKESNPR